MGELVESFKTVHYIYLLPTIVLMVLSYVFRAYRWQILLQPIKQVEVSSLYSPLMVGFMGNVLPARAGEVVRAYLLSKKHNISFTGSVASIIVERLFDIFMLLLLFAWVFIGHAEIISPELEIKGVSVQGLASKFGMVSATLLVLLIVFIYLLLTQKEKMLKMIHWCTRPLPEKWKGKIEYLVDEFILGFQVAKDMGALMKITGFSVLVWASITLSYYPMYWAYDLQDKSLQSVVLVTVMVAILITLLPTPAFLGSFNAAVLIALHDVMNESEIIAVSFGMVTWALSFGVIIAGGIYFILHDHLSVKKLVEVEESEIEDLK